MIFRIKAWIVDRLWRLFCRPKHVGEDRGRRIYGAVVYETDKPPPEAYFRQDALVIIVPPMSEEEKRAIADYNPFEDDLHDSRARDGNPTMAEPGAPDRSVHRD